MVCPAPGRAGLLLSLVRFPKKGRAERLGVSPRPRRHGCRNAVDTHGALRLLTLQGTGQPYARRAHGRAVDEDNPPQKQDNACVPHAMDFAACLHVPGGVAGADACPVRAGCCPDMHLGRPPVCRRLSHGAVKRPRSGIVAATATRSTSTKTLATRPLSVRVSRNVFRLIGNVKRLVFCEPERISAGPAMRSGLALGDCASRFLRVRVQA